MIATAYTFAGWIVFDCKLFMFVLGIAFFSTVSVMTLLFTGRKWHEYVTFSFVIFLAVTVVLIVGLNFLVQYPVFKIEDIIAIE